MLRSGWIALAVMVAEKVGRILPMTVTECLPDGFDLRAPADLHAPIGMHLR